VQSMIAQVTMRKSRDESELLSRNIPLLLAIEEIKNPISPRATIAVPTIVAAITGFSELLVSVEVATACWAPDTRRAGSGGVASCGFLPAVARYPVGAGNSMAMLASRLWVVATSAAGEFWLCLLGLELDLVRVITWWRAVRSRRRNPGSRKNQTPQRNFPRNMRMVKSTPRQRTARENISVIGIAKPIEAKKNGWRICLKAWEM